MEGKRVDGEKTERNVEQDVEQDVTPTVTVDDAPPKILMDVADLDSFYKSTCSSRIHIDVFRINGGHYGGWVQPTVEWADEVESQMDRRFGPIKPQWLYEMWMQRTERIYD